MFKLNENYEIDRRILKCGYVRYSPAETSPINTLKSQIYIRIPKEDSVFSVFNSYYDQDFEVIKKADIPKYGSGNNIRLMNLGPFALFSNFELTTSSGKHLDDISHANLVSLKYKQKTSSKDSDDLSIGFDRSRNRRRDELAQNKNLKCKHHV